MEVVTQTRRLHAREAVQALTQALVEACGGVLRDEQQRCVSTGTAAE
jgi:hypothetical protein